MKSFNSELRDGHFIRNDENEKKRKILHRTRSNNVVAKLMSFRDDENASADILGTDRKTSYSVSEEIVMKRGTISV